MEMHSMNRREFMSHSSIAAAAGFTASMTLVEKAEALESVMVEGLEREAAVPWYCDVARKGDNIGDMNKLKLMGDDPRLSVMPDKPGLADYFEHRFGTNMGTQHLLQSAQLAADAGLPDKTVLACLLHDIAVLTMPRHDHGYWAAQLIEPYVDEEVSWAVRHHQALRFFPDPDFDYEYPQSYIKLFGEDYRVLPYIEQAAEYATNHKWYATARHICVNDLYSFDPKKRIEISEFTDLIGRNFREPAEGLGFDTSPSAHMWRTMIWPNSYL
jgi:hypothetical protein